MVQIKQNCLEIIVYIKYYVLAWTENYLRENIKIHGLNIKYSKTILVTINVSHVGKPNK